MRKSLCTLLLFAVLVSGCNSAGTATPGAPTEAAVAATRTRTPPPPKPTLTLTPTLAPTLTPAPSATSVIFPILTFAADAVCRSGPGVRYFARVRIEKGQSFEASGRNADASWLAVQAARLGDDCWVQASNLEDPGDLSALRIIETQPLPETPINFTASSNACGGVKHLWLYWSDVSAIGYRIYRSGKEIATVYGNQYRDLNTPRSKLPEAYRYEIEAFNASGVSERVGLSVTICG